MDKNSFNILKAENDHLKHVVSDLKEQLLGLIEANEVLSDLLDDDEEDLK